MAQQYTTIHDFVDELYLNKILRGLPLETIIRYTVNFMKIVGVPKMFDDRTAFIDIKDHIGKLPCDFYKMIQVRGGKNIGTEVVYREATDTFHMSAIKEKRVDEYFLEKQKKPIAHQLTDTHIRYKGMPL